MFDVLLPQDRMRRVLLLFMCVALSWAKECTQPEVLDLDGTVTADQSSNNIEQPLPVAGKAINLKTTTDHSVSPCAVTQKENEPWWSLDLKDIYTIHSVVIWNRMDKDSESLRGGEIRIGNSPTKENPVCGTVTDTSEERVFIPCFNMKGRYLYVIVPERTVHLQLCEVEVYGKPLNLSCYGRP
uniref:Fucolectin tachylectin-4 pentraxin-1 domain-containing protein n=1 Tax=Leptobrachium leishanense TaxID=445787 RepID=A0A8C5PUP1_9ANUR